jgi:hypothetical protein
MTALKWLASKTGAAWKQEQARIAALIRQAQTRVNDRVAQEGSANVDT